MNFFPFIIFIHVNVLLLSKHASAGKDDNEVGPSTKRAKKDNLGVKTKIQIAKIYLLLRKKEKCVKHYLNNKDLEIEMVLYFVGFEKFIDKLPKSIKNLYKIELDNVRLNEENEEQTNSIVLEKMGMKKGEISFNDEIGLIKNFATTLMEMVTKHLKILNFKPIDSIKNIIAYHVDQIYSEALNRWNGIGMALLGQLHGSLPVNLPINVQNKYTQFFISSKIAISLIGKALKVSPFLEDNTMEYKNVLKKMTKHLDRILHEAFAKRNIDVESIKIPCETFEQNVQTFISDVQQMIDIENADPTNYNKYKHIYWIKCIKTAISELIKMVDVLTEIDANFDKLKTIEKIIKSAQILEKIRNILLTQK